VGRERDGRGRKEVIMAALWWCLEVLWILRGNIFFLYFVIV
jgi:hypothetical protein